MNFTPFEATLAWTGIGITLLAGVIYWVGMRFLDWSERRNFPPGK
jgi:hypothetical protein